MVRPARHRALRGINTLSRSLFWRVGVGLSLTLTSSLAAAEPKDAQATALAKQAMQEDYVGTQFKQAEQKLKKALKQCGKGCSTSVLAQLHRDLAVVYIAGLAKKKDGKREMQAALKADASVQLDPDFTTPDVEKAFVAAGGVLPPKEEAEPELEEDEPAPAEPAPEPADESDSVTRNFVSLGFQLDFLVYSATEGVCSGAEQYQCFSQGESYGGPIYGGSGNRVQGGVGLATKRVLVGYERLFGQNITLGGRLGFAFGGSPKATSGDASAFLPIHAELRGSYWFGEAPLASAGVRAYAGLAAGVGEVDGHVTVEYFTDETGYRDGNVGTLDAWRKTGSLLLGLHGGLGYAFSPQHALLLELRLQQMLPQSALAGGAGIAYSLGL